MRLILFELLRFFRIFLRNASHSCHAWHIFPFFFNKTSITQPLKKPCLAEVLQRCRIIFDNILRYKNIYGLSVNSKDLMLGRFHAWQAFFWGFFNATLISQPIKKIYMLKAFRTLLRRFLNNYTRICEVSLIFSRLKLSIQQNGQPVKQFFAFVKNINLLRQLK